MATEIRHASSLSIANAFLGYLKLLQGDLEAAVVALTRGLAIAEEHDLMHGVCANGLYLAWASLLGGDRARGLEYLERGLERPAGAQLQWTRFGSVPAAVYLAAGCPDKARPIIARGLADMTERDARGYRGPLLRLEAELRLGDGDAATARTRAEEALALARELGARPEGGWCHATLARITGSPEHLAAAQRTFGELGMTFWAERLGRLTL